MPEPDDVWLDRLFADGLVRRDGDVVRTTRRWQGAMARAALRLLDCARDGDDLRLPIAYALVELYGELDDEDITRAVGAILPIEAGEIARATAR